MQDESHAIIHLQTIPVASPRCCENILTSDSWRNPYLFIAGDEISLRDLVFHTELKTKPENLLLALAALPRSAWPYGRIVAVSENGVLAPGDNKTVIEARRAVVSKTLQKAKIDAIWFPPA